MSNQPDLDLMAHSFLTAAKPEAQEEVLEDIRRTMTPEDYDGLLDMLTEGDRKAGGTGNKYRDPKPQK